LQSDTSIFRWLHFDGEFYISYHKVHVHQLARIQGLSTLFFFQETRKTNRKTNDKKTIEQKAEQPEELQTKGQTEYTTFVCFVSPFFLVESLSKSP
jgi:hypothetical protein